MIQVSTKNGKLLINPNNIVNCELKHNDHEEYDVLIIKCVNGENLILSKQDDNNIDILKIFDSIRKYESSIYVNFPSQVFLNMSKNMGIIAGELEDMRGELDALCQNTFDIAKKLKGK